MRLKVASRARKRPAYMINMPTVVIGRRPPAKVILAAVLSDFFAVAWYSDLRLL